ncbi:MAG TPA: dihydrolipoamide acetyltransferase family protein [Burkholderiales bacterium]|nr:dihydrolipoamide acetyltransferase family protein [Burkholderiales bacterium]
MRVFVLPDLGEGLQEAEIVEWRVAPGDEVAVDQIIVAVETDKAIVEVPAPHSGRIEKLFGNAGDVVHVGAPLVGFEGETEDTGTVVGELAAASVARHGAGETRIASAGVRATPAVRALARKLNVDLAAIQPSGPSGTVTVADVERAAKSPALGGTEETLHGMRRTMARNMALAHAEVASVTVVDDADVESWAGSGSPMPRLVRAIVAACRIEPGLNAWYDAKTSSRRVLEEVHVGLAVDTSDGLLVPVLRDCHRRDLEDLAQAISSLARDARERRLAPEALRGATISLSNYGAIAGRYASPIVVPPMVAIVGAGRLEPRPIVAPDGQIVAHRTLPISLTFDHRAVTGGEAGRFLNAVLRDLSNPL